LGESSGPKDVQKELGKMWKDASDATKEKYKKMYEENKKEYEKQLEAVKVTADEDKKTESGSGRVLRKRAPKKDAEEEPSTKKKKTTKKAESGAKKVTGYQLFQKEQREKLKDEKLDAKKIQQQISKLWKEVSDDEKKKYNEKAKAESTKKASSDEESDN